MEHRHALVLQLALVHLVQLVISRVLIIQHANVRLVVQLATNHVWDSPRVMRTRPSLEIALVLGNLLAELLVLARSEMTVGKTLMLMPKYMLNITYCITLLLILFFFLLPCHFSTVTATNLVLTMRGKLEIALVLNIVHVSTPLLLARLEMTVGKTLMPKSMLNITVLHQHFS